MEDQYDVVIIGAGVSGLVCGCYLAKAGMKVLIVERRANVGGCCTSFETRGYRFDAFAHSLGGLRENGTLEIVLRELGIKDRFKVNRHDPSDIIVSPDYKIYFWNDLKRTIEDLQSHFPHEAPNISSLMQYLAHSKGENTMKLMNVSFSTFLNNFIQDMKLKAILSVPVLGNAGLPPSSISAFTAAKLYQEFHLDGGYHPEGGMQAFPDLLVSRFKELGGKILLSKPVVKILMTNKNRVSGIGIKGNEKIFSKVVVSNCDVTQTFLNFMGKTNIKSPNIKQMEPSISFFSGFVGLDENPISINGELRSTVWYMFNYDLEKIYIKTKDGNFDNIECFLIYGSPDKKGFVISILAPFKSRSFWEKNKNKFFEKLIKITVKNIPSLNKVNIRFKTCITPQSIYRWTSNLSGAAYGWASTPSQFIVTGLTQKTHIENLYLTGHWTTQTLGVCGVAYMGRDTAKMIIGRK
jgi:prolycopene isomerase